MTVICHRKKINFHVKFLYQRITYPCRSSGMEMSIKSTADVYPCAMLRLSSLLAERPRKSRLPNLLVWRGSFKFKVKFCRNIAASANMSSYKSFPLHKSDHQQTYPTS